MSELQMTFLVSLIFAGGMLVGFVVWGIGNKEKSMPMKEPEQSFTRTGTPTGRKPINWWRLLFYIVLMITGSITAKYGIDIGNNIKTLESNIKEQQSKCRYRSGFTSEYKGKPLCYTLFTNNNGHNWYVVKEYAEYTNGFSCTASENEEIIGPVERFILDYLNI
jgi:hypothetical protein